MQGGGSRFLRIGNNGTRKSDDLKVRLRNYHFSLYIRFTYKSCISSAILRFGHYLSYLNCISCNSGYTRKKRDPKRSHAEKRRAPVCCHTKPLSLHPRRKVSMRFYQGGKSPCWCKEIPVLFDLCGEFSLSHPFRIPSESLPNPFRIPSEWATLFLPDFFHLHSISWQLLQPWYNLCNWQTVT